MEDSHMGAKIFNFLATLLLSVPLAAIGLMAMFGIPQLVPAVAGPQSEAVLRNVRNAIPWGRTSVNAANAQPAEDAPSFDAPPTARPRPAERDAVSDVTPLDGRSPPASARNPKAEESSPLHWSQTPALASIPAPRPRSAAGSLGDEPRASIAASGLGAHLQERSPPSGPLLTWRQASLRLAELGIKNYHLERGSTEGAFLFVCVFTPPDAPHVLHRFESETDDPLTAVNQVLHQVDGWMQGRFAAANFPPRPQSLSLSTSGPQR
jgi:hypothetical protein